MKVDSVMCRMFGTLKAKYYVSIFLCLMMFSGCATGLNSHQDRQVAEYKSKGQYVQEKDSTLAAVLGILPGGESFYTGHYGYGFVNLLFWPLSILWDPISGYNGAEVTNYYATKVTTKRYMKKEIKNLDNDLEDDKITEKEYILKKREIEDKYAVE